MKILVTGGAGFIGSYVIDLLIKKGHEVYCIDDLSGGYKRNINKKCHFKKINLVNRNATRKYIETIRPETVFHLAADATEGRSQFTPINCTQRNYIAFLNTIVPSITSGLRKFIFISSMSVYGEQKPPFTEEMDTNPVDIYGISKSASEKALKIFSDVYGFQYTIIRPHNVYGPRQNLADPYRNVIGIFINQLLNNKKYFIYGNGEQRRAFSYIDDVAPYIVKAGLGNQFNGEIFNIGPKKSYTINQMSDIILKLFFGDKNNVPKNLLPEYLKSRPQEVVNAYCSSKKASKLLGYKSSVSLENGIRRMIKWAKKLGPQKFRYLKNLELENESTPQTWKTNFKNK